MTTFWCTGFMPIKFYVKLLKNGLELETHDYFADWNVPMLVLESEYEAEDEFTINVTTYTQRLNILYRSDIDFTVGVYST